MLDIQVLAGLGVAHKCGVVELVSGISTLSFMLIGSPTTIQIYINKCV
jgi:hypothetical protein